MLIEKYPYYKHNWELKDKWESLKEIKDKAGAKSNVT